MPTSELDKSPLQYNRAMRDYSRRSCLAWIAAGAGATVLGADTGKKPLSAASKRALNYTKGPEWFCYFRQQDVTGDLAYEPGIHRRDPTAVIRVNGVYHVWYSKSPGVSSGFGTGDPTKKVFPWDL